MADHSSEWKKLRNRLVKEHGLRVELSRAQHWKVFRGNELISVMPKSPGGGRGYRNQLADLRRKGINV